MRQRTPTSHADFAESAEHEIGRQIRGKNGRLGTRKPTRLRITERKGEIVKPSLLPDFHRRPNHLPLAAARASAYADGRNSGHWAPFVSFNIEETATMPYRPDRRTISLLVLLSAFLSSAGIRAAIRPVPRFSAQRASPSTWTWSSRTPNGSARYPYGSTSPKARLPRQSCCSATASAGHGRAAPYLGNPWALRGYIAVF